MPRRMHRLTLHCTRPFGHYRRSLLHALLLLLLLLLLLQLLLLLLLLVVAMIAIVTR